MEIQRKKPPLIYLIKIHAIELALQKFKGDRRRVAGFLGITLSGLRNIINENEFLAEKYNTHKNKERTFVTKDLVVMVRMNKNIKDSLYYRYLVEEEKEFADKIIEDFKNGVIN